MGTCYHYINPQAPDVSRTNSDFVRFVDTIFATKKKKECEINSLYANPTQSM